METGVLGANGVHAASRVVEESKPGHVNVAVHLPNMAAVTVPVLTQKTMFAQADFAQVSIRPCYFKKQTETSQSSL